MIFYVVKQLNPITAYLRTSGKDIANLIRPLSYELLKRTVALDLGTYIFSDIERLTTDEADVAARVWQSLARASETVSLLNHPTRSMRRYELLRTLHEREYNSFNVYRLTTDCLRAVRFPVFLRCENDHAGSITDLLFNRRELEEAVATLWRSGQSQDDTIIVEFCDTSDAGGVFRKYGAFCIRGNVVPDHLFFGKHWELKRQSKRRFINEASLREEKEYLERNPHQDSIREIFEMAAIDYGRIDYGIIDGRLQVWEINTNPQLPGLLHLVEPERRSLKERCSKELNAVIQTIADEKVDRGMVIIASDEARSAFIFQLVARLPTSWQQLILRIARIVLAVALTIEQYWRRILCHYLKKRCK